MRSLFYWLAVASSIIIGPLFCVAQQQTLEEVGTALTAAKNKNHIEGTNVSPDLIRGMVADQNKMLQNIEAISATNKNFKLAAGYIVAAMAGHAPPKLPEGVTQSDLTNAYFQMFIAPQLAQATKLAKERIKPIAFYGKVVDEATQAVADASVHFMWVDPKSTSKSDTTSAADGSFSLTGVLGSTVNVDVWKTGYYVVKSLKEYNFDNTGNGSSRENPVMFHLRKRGNGADLISATLNVKISRDGTPVNVDFLNRNSGASGQLQMSQIKPPYESWKQATEWSFRMTIPNGGFVEENDEFPFEAPESGYQPVIEFDFKAGQPDWQTDLKKSYYIVFGNPPCYGYLTILTDISWGGARITYAVNPDGSRHLEPKNSTQ